MRVVDLECGRLILLKTWCCETIRLSRRCNVCYLVPTNTLLFSSLCLLHSQSTQLSHSLSVWKALVFVLAAVELLSRCFFSYHVTGCLAAVFSAWLADYSAVTATDSLPSLLLLPFVSYDFRVRLLRVAGKDHQREDLY